MPNIKRNNFSSSSSIFVMIWPTDSLLCLLRFRFRSRLCKKEVKKKKKIPNSLVKNVLTIFHFEIARTNNTTFRHCIRSCNKNIFSKNYKKVSTTEEEAEKWIDENNPKYITRRIKSYFKLTTSPEWQCNSINNWMETMAMWNVNI